MFRQKGVTPQSITVPTELKARMDAVTERVNWSAVAAAAFLEKLNTMKCAPIRKPTRLMAILEDLGRELMKLAEE